MKFKNMVGIIIILLLSAFIIHFSLREKLWVFGVRPATKRLLQLFKSFFYMFLIHQSMMLGETLLREVEWTISSHFSLSKLFEGLYYHLKSAAYEELLFRGAIFLILIKKLGAKWSIIVSSSAFGIYHWFTYNLLGQPGQMIFIFFITAIGGALFAYAYIKSGSILVPFGLHSAWNISNALYSRGSLGEFFLVEISGNAITGIAYIITMIFYQIIPPLAMYLFIRYSFKNRKTELQL